MGRKFGEKLVDKIGGVTKKIFDKAREKKINVIDKKEDGKIDFDYMAKIAEDVGTKVAEGGKALKEGTEEMIRQSDLRVLKPVFPEMLNDGDFYLSKFIRLTERPRKYKTSPACKNSIGNINEIKKFSYVTIFADSIDTFGVSFYPDSDAEFYYMDPEDKNLYISLDEYFDYMKRARFNELKDVARDLGAKFFKVIYKEEQTSFSEIKGKGKVKGNAKVKATVEAQHQLEKKKYSYKELMSENETTGHYPEKPKLKYLRNDPNVNSLIKSRMDAPTSASKIKDSIHLVQTCGMKEKDAANIDLALSALRISGNATVAGEAKNESRRYLEYEIEF